MLPVLRGVGTAVALGLAACGGGDGAGTGPGGDPNGGGDGTPGEVIVGDNFFRPAQTIVRREGEQVTVMWRWTERNLHNVTFDVGGTNSVTQRSGTFSRTFTEAGTFTYFCTIHGRAVMSGTVEVQ